jgi:hypothetical protein
VGRRSLKIHPGRVPGTKHGCRSLDADSRAWRRAGLCPAGISLDGPGTARAPMLLGTDGYEARLFGRLIGRIEKPPRCGEPCVVAAGPRGATEGNCTPERPFDAKGQIIGGRCRPGFSCRRKCSGSWRKNEMVEQTIHTCLQ